MKEFESQSPWFSMTGYGAAETTISGRRLFVEMRSVNQKNREIRVFSSPKNLAWEHGVQQMVSGLVHRGKIDIRVAVEHQSGSGSGDGAAIHRLRGRLYRLGIVMRNQAPDPKLLARLATEADTGDQSDIDFDVVHAVAQEAANQLLQSRLKEGVGLRDIVAQQKARLAAKVNGYSRHQDAEHAARQQLLSQKLAMLQSGGVTPPDRQRLEEEITFQLIRSDVVEELDRLQLHLKNLDALFAKASPVGKELDVLIQEIGREVHTLCSKSSLVEAKDAAMSLRPIVDQLREQAQNIE